jgi:hypothetical protein
MKPTYTSRPIHIIDAPVPGKPRLKFYYNFFEADERVDDTPPRLKKPISSLTSREIQLKIPRYVEVSWSPSISKPSLSERVETTQQFLLGNESSIANEANVLTDSTMVYFQDFDHLNRIGERFEASARMRGILTGSSTDTAAKLNLVTRDETDGDLMQRYLSLAAQNRAMFVNQDGIAIEPVDASAADQLAIIVDNDFAANCLRDSDSSPVSSVALVVRQNSRVAVARTKRKRSKMPVQEELELELDSIEDTPLSFLGAPKKFQHIGYMVERFEVGVSDTISKRRRFFIPSPQITKLLDDNVKYGIQYTYSVRTILAFFTTTTRDNGDLQMSKFLVASRPSTFSSVLTEERVPPPPPSDLNFRWDYQRSSLQIDWAFPSNTQRDIKGWQVFRRKSLNDPFSLIAQIDFDDSVIRTPSSETVDRSLVKRYESATTFFVDQEFDKDSEYIYAVCSVDAHAMTSNYSSQYQVRFDRIQNKLLKNYVSPSGAAKQYPNTYLKAEISLDSVKSMKAENIRVYFDPEYLKVVDRQNRDLQILKSDARGGVYRFMLLNTDRQLQSNLDITIRDTRSLITDGSSNKPADSNKKVY